MPRILAKKTPDWSVIEPTCTLWNENDLCVNRNLLVGIGIGMVLSFCFVTLQMRNNVRVDTVITISKPTAEQVPAPKLLNYSGSDPWKKELYDRLDRVVEKCGSLCSINDLKQYEQKGKHTPGNAYSTFTAPVDCTTLFQMEEIDAGDVTVPYPIPEELVHLYSLDGAFTVGTYGGGKLSAVYLGGAAFQNVWTKEAIEDDLKLLAEGQMKGTYGEVYTNRLRDRLVQQGGLNGHSVLVVGSEKPWVETIALYVGAAKVTTVEYGAIKSEHPQIHTLTPSEFRTQYLNGNLTHFDSVLTISSLEHSGLGRYGDALNPWGDILSLARCWCVTKPDGLLMLGVPTGKDDIEFNAHRWYGNIRMPLITTNWIPIDGTKDFHANGHDLMGIQFFKKIEP